MILSILYKMLKVLPYLNVPEIDNLFLVILSEYLPCCKALHYSKAYRAVHFFLLSWAVFRLEDLLQLSVCAQKQHAAVSIRWCHQDLFSIKCQPFLLLLLFHLKAIALSRPNPLYHTSFIILSFTLLFMNEIMPLYARNSYS